MSEINIVKELIGIDKKYLTGRNESELVTLNWKVHGFRSIVYK